MARPEKGPKKDFLFEAILRLESAEECYHFLKICAPSRRWTIP